MQLHPLAKTAPLAKFFGQIWFELGEIWAKAIKFGQIGLDLEKIKNLASPKTFDLLRLCLFT